MGKRGTYVKYKRVETVAAAKRSSTIKKVFCIWILIALTDGAVAKFTGVQKITVSPYFKSVKKNQLNSGERPRKDPNLTSPPHFFYDRLSIFIIILKLFFPSFPSIFDTGNRGVRPFRFRDCMHSELCAGRCCTVVWKWEELVNGEWKRRKERKKSRCHRILPFPTQLRSVPLFRFSFFLFEKMQLQLVHRRRKPSPPLFSPSHHWGFGLQHARGEGEERGEKRRRDVRGISNF